jgi:hypothetical protein
MLTKGDNNEKDDRLGRIFEGVSFDGMKTVTKRRNLKFVQKEHIMGRVRG